MLIIAEVERRKGLSEREENMLAIAEDMLLVGYGADCTNDCVAPGTALVGIMLGDVMGGGEKALAIGGGENDWGNDCCIDLGCCIV